MEQKRHSQRSKKALLIVDPQNDFFPGGALGVPDGNAIIPFLNALIKHAVKKGWHIIVTRDWHPVKTAHFKKWAIHCVHDTVGAEFPAALQLPERYVLFSKGMSTVDDGYSPFEAVGEDEETLDAVLHFLGITDLYIAGLATDYCVKAGVLDAIRHDYKAILIADAVKAVNIKPDDGEIAVLKMADAGAVIATTKEVLNETV